MKNRYLLVSIMIIFPLILIMSILSFAIMNEVNRDRKKRDDITNSLYKIVILLSRITDAETSQRGYVITGQNEYLEPYNKALIYFQSPDFKTLFTNNEEDQTTLNELQRHIEEKLAELKLTIDLRNTKGFESTLSVISKNEGKQSMDQIRGILESMSSLKENHIHQYNLNIDQKINSLILLILTSAALIFLGIIMFLFFLRQEMNIRKKIEMALKELSEWQTAVFNSTKQAILTFDLNSKIVSFNKGAEAIFGYTSSEVINNPTPPFYSGTDNSKNLKELSNKFKVELSSLNDYIMYLIEHKIPSNKFTWKARRKDKAIIDFESTFTLLKDALGNINGAVLTGSDETKRNQWEKELIEAKQKAIIASSSKSCFLANVSHDLRTPLNSIIGFSNLLLKNKLNNLHKDQITYLERVSDNGKLLLLLINSILDLTKIEEGKTKVTKTMVNVGELISSIAKMTESQILNRNLKLILEIPENVKSIETDSQSLSQILTNLLGNSIKFTSEGTITIRLLKDEMTNMPKQIDVIDTGKGIEKDQISKIFEAFYQVEGEINRHFAGTGLGLSIAAALAKLLNFDLKVTSEIGKGSTFSVILTPPTQLKDINQDAVTKSKKIKKRILVIDDEEDSRYLLKQYFEGLECEVVTVEFGEDGIKKAKEDPFDLITVDDMSPLNGFQIIEQLQADSKLKNIPIVLISISADEVKNDLPNIKAFLNKPVNEEELRKILDATLQNHPELSEDIAMHAQKH